MLQEKEYAPVSPCVIFYTFNLKEIADTVFCKYNSLILPCKQFYFYFYFCLTILYWFGYDKNKNIWFLIMTDMLGM